MNRVKWIFFFSLVFSLFAQDNYLESSSAGEQIKVGLVSFRSDASLEDQRVTVQKVLQFDLGLDGRFQLLHKDKISPLWVNQGVQYFVTGKLNPTLDDQIQMELNLNDMYTGDALLGKLYTVDQKGLRKAVHHFTEQLIAQIYGTPGVGTSKLLYIQKVRGVKNLVQMDYDGANRQQITSGPTIKTFPEWGPNGNSVLFTAFAEEGTQLRQVRLRDGKSRTLYAGKMQAFLPRMSPDQKSLAFVGVKNRNTDLYQLDLASKKVQQITSGPRAETSPAWAPEGKDLYFSLERGGGPQIYKMNLEKGEAERVTFIGRYNESVAVSPEGDKIAYCSMGGGEINLFTMDLFTGEIVQLTAGQGNNESPTWSPDGRLIAFSSTRTGKSQLYVMRADGTGVLRLTSKGENSQPVWSRLWNEKGE